MVFSQNHPKVCFPRRPHEEWNGKKGTEERGGGTCVGQGDVANEIFQEHRAARSCKRIGGRTRCPFRVAVLSPTDFSGMDAHDGNKASKRRTRGPAEAA